MSNRPSYLSLWIHIICMANHKEKKMMWNGEILSINEGQFVTGRKELSIKTGIPETTIEDILKFLERQQQIRQQKTTKYRLITVINWEKYQHSDIVSDNKATTKRQQADTNKNDKNVKNEKNNIGRFAPPTLLEVKAYCQERNNEVDPDKWHNFYSAKGWMVGKNKMKDWKAAVRTWEEKKVGSYTAKPLPPKEEFTEEQRKKNLEMLEKMKLAIGLNKISIKK